MAVNAELAAQGSLAGGRSMPAPLCPFSSSRRRDEQWAPLETQLGEMQRGTAGGPKSKGLSAAGGARQLPRALDTPASVGLSFPEACAHQQLGSG